MCYFRVVHKFGNTLAATFPHFGLASLPDPRLSRLAPSLICHLRVIDSRRLECTNKFCASRRIAC